MLVYATCVLLCNNTVILKKYKLLIMASILLMLWQLHISCEHGQSSTLSTAQHDLSTCCLGLVVFISTISALLSVFCRYTRYTYSSQYGQNNAVFVDHQQWMVSYTSASAEAVNKRCDLWLSKHHIYIPTVLRWYPVQTSNYREISGTLCRGYTVVSCTALEGHVSILELLYTRYKIFYFRHEAHS